MLKWQVFVNHNPSFGVCKYPTLICGFSRTTRHYNAGIFLAKLLKQSFIKSQHLQLVRKGGEKLLDRTNKHGDFIS